jgi:hypothetical protein
MDAKRSEHCLFKRSVWRFSGETEVVGKGTPVLH